MTVSLDDILIREEPAPGDLGYVMYLHGIYYRPRYGYGIEFESYVALAVHEIYRHYDPDRDRIWICEHQGRIIGSLVLMHRDKDAAQLRLFLVLPEYQGIGLGGYLMRRFLETLRERGYRSAFLWTTEEQETAVALYRRLGFTLTEEKTSTAFGKPLVEQRYELVVA
ncbi:MAG TPA: GNAT family N-acetyltransferase [Arenicellales bacterium]|nr:GNAT family N-acetyltransferase [Arenicellales bacterium]